jgi:hypothetical protein
MSARPPTQRFTSAERAFKMPSKTATNPTSDRKRPLLGSKDQQQMFNAKVPIVRVEGHFFPKPMSSKPTKERTIGTAGQREEKAYKLAYDEQLCTNFPLMRLVIDIGQNENGVSSLPADRRLALEEVSAFFLGNYQLKGFNF